MPKPLTRNYNLTFAELIMHSNAIQTFMVRDTTEFTSYGIDATEIASFRTDIDELENLPIDDEMLNAVTIATNNKEAIRDDITSQLREIEQRARLAFGLNSKYVNYFDFKRVSNLSDGSFLLKSRRVKRYCDTYLTDLTPYGMTQAMIDELDTANQNFEEAKDAQIDAIAERDDATNTRIEKSNAVYDKLMRYCTTGKTIWFDVNEAKYNDYLTYSMPPGVPGKIQNLAYETSSGAASWDQEPTATTYQLEFAIDIGSEPIWTVIYEGPGTTYTYDPGGPDNYLFRCRGKNENGYGYWSDVLTVERP